MLPHQNFQITTSKYLKPLAIGKNILNLQIQTQDIKSLHLHNKLTTHTTYNTQNTFLSTRHHLFTLFFPFHKILNFIHLKLQYYPSLPLFIFYKPKLLILLYHLISLTYSVSIMDNNNNNQSFWQFSDQLRLQSSNLANLSLNDPIWSVNSRKPHRRNFDIRVGGDLASSDFNTTNNHELNHAWKIGSGSGSGSGINLNGGFNKGIYSNISDINNNYYNDKYYKNIGFKGEEEYVNSGSGYNNNNKGRKKNKEVKKENNNNNNSNNNEKENKIGGDNNKRFKTLPASEALPRNETVGGYIFVCNNDTMEENLQRQLFGLPPRYRDSVRQITPGLPLFLYNYSTHQLHGIYQAASFGGTNIDPTAWEDKKNPGESRFPAQVKVQTRKLCEPLDEDAFRPILHHYDGPKFRLELSVPEALSLLDIFVEDDA